MSAYVATNINAAADSEGQSLSGNTNSAAGRDNAIVLSGTGKNTLGDDVSNGGVKNESGLVLTGDRNQIGGVQVAGTNQGSITVNSSEGVEAVTKTFAETVKEFLGGKKTPTEGKPLDTTEADNADTAADVTKPLMWVVGVVLTILVGIWLARRKRKTA